MTYDELIHHLKSNGDANVVDSMARYGVPTTNIYGITLPELRQLAKQVRSKDKGQNHTLAQQLWQHDSRETRILATLIDHYQLITPLQMEAWVIDFDSWEICDQCCSNLFRYTPFAYDKAFAWSQRKEEFVKRAGFVLMVGIALKDKKAPDSKIAEFLPLLEREAWDGRNFVKKAVNWALRQIGKRSLYLNGLAIETAVRIQQQKSQSAHWIAQDALRELQKESIQTKLRQKANK